MANELIISCPVVGAELTKDIYPALPTTPDEIAKAAKDAVKAGASIIHLHVRDKLGRPTQDINIFKEVTEKIRKECDCIIQYSTGGAIGSDLNDRHAPLTLKPEMGTLSMGTMNFGTGVFLNDDKTITTISKALIDNDVMAELEIFDYGMLEAMEKYKAKGLLPQKYHIDFVLGVPGGMSGHIRNLIMLVDRLEKNQTWAVAGIGRFQLPLATQAITMGGHVRVGIEDNYFYRKGEPATSNAQLIKRVVRIANELDRPISTVDNTKKILGIKS